MSDSPLVSRVATLIFETFDVSDEFAREHAYGLVLLAEEWGEPASALRLDWSYRVKKALGEKLPWRSELAREAFYRDRQLTFKAYEGYIRRVHST